MKRAATPKVLATLTHYRALGKKLDQIVCFTNFAYVFVGEDGALLQMKRPLKTSEQARACSHFKVIALCTLQRKLSTVLDVAQNRANKLLGGIELDHWT